LIPKGTGLREGKGKSGHQGLRGRQQGSYLMVIEFHFCKMKEFWRFISQQLEYT
jgi:hypothetical protein